MLLPKLLLLLLPFFLQLILLLFHDVTFTLVSVADATTHAEGSTNVVVVVFLTNADKIK
jgi:hypothetical protein